MQTMLNIQAHISVIITTHSVVFMIGSAVMWLVSTPIHQDIPTLLSDQIWMTV